MSRDTTDRQATTSVSSRQLFRRCERAHFFKYELGLRTEMTGPLRMGSAFSDALEEWDISAADRAYRTFIIDDPSIAFEAKRELQVVRIMAAEYQLRYTKPDLREIKFDSHDFGFIDGLERNEDGTGFYLIEDKLKGRWTAAEAAMLQFNDQVESYALAAQELEEEHGTFLGVKYRVTLKPQHRWTNEGQGFNDKVHKAVSERRGKDNDYFKEILIPASVFDFDEIREEIEEDTKIIESTTVFRRTGVSTGHCGAFGGCSYAKLCLATNDDDKAAALKELQ